MVSNIILLGFMGTGKSTLGEALSFRLSMPFVDLDREIEKVLQLPIPRIFTCYGEEYFRQQESKILSSVLSRRGQVVATGGGVVLKEENRSLIKKRGLSILLTSAVDVILQRTKGSNRPLLQGPDPEKQIRELLKEREEAYSFADYSFATDQFSLNEAVHLIIRMVGEHPGRIHG